MSVCTESDRKIDKAKDSIQEVWDNVIDVIKGDVWGTSDYNQSYIDNLMEVQILLLKIKRLL